MTDVLKQHKALPTGTVTFLFTDIEGSTERWERHRQAMQAAVRRHEEILHAAIAAPLSAETANALLEAGAQMSEDEAIEEALRV